MGESILKGFLSLLQTFESQIEPSLGVLQRGPPPTKAALLVENPI